MRSAAALLLIVVLAAAAPAAETTYKLVPVWPALGFFHPVWMTWPDDSSDRLFVIEQPGKVWCFHQNEPNPKPKLCLDITDRVNSAGTEEGLLCMAFHPGYEKDGRAYLWYCIEHPKRNRLSCFKRDAVDPDKLDPASEEVLIDVDDFAPNHNGGTTLFGPDGMLYQSIGDGGGGGDPHGNGQKRDTLLGKVWRIDVDHRDPGFAYAVPKDNPFAGLAGARGEIWAWGCRNMWRMSFDRETHQLWAGDVGQDSFEEVDIIVKGGNYGWNYREGTHPFRGHEPPPNAIEPVLDYPAAIGKSVTGGYVYRGKKLPELIGSYLYADFVKGPVWALTMRDGKLASNREIAHRGQISSFAEDRDGEVYAIAYGDKGTILRFERE
jgi:glucose/arabinose dehydrogenase